MKVAVTGAGGLLAAELLPTLESAGHEALPLAHEAADVTDLETLRKAILPFRPDWLFHLAAFTRVDECEAREEHAMVVNAEGSRNAAHVANEADAALLAISSDYVFDGTATRPYREHDPTRPINAYGRSKWEGEQAIRETTGRHIIVRSSWLYGAGGANFVDTILNRAGRGEPLSVVDDQRGTPTWTRDLATRLIRLAEGGSFGTYHCAGHGAATWYELAEHAIASAGLGVRLERTSSDRLGRPAPRPGYSALDSTMCDHTTGMPMPEWKESVSAYVQERVASVPRRGGRP